MSQIKQTIEAPLKPKIEETLKDGRWFTLDYYLSNKEMVYISTYIERFSEERPYIILTNPEEVSLIDYINRLSFLRSNLEFSTHLVGQTDLLNARVTQTILSRISVDLTCTVSFTDNATKEVYSKVIPLTNAHRVFTEKHNKGFYCDKIVGIPKNKDTNSLIELLEIYFDLIIR